MRYTKFTRIENPTRKQVWQAMLRGYDFWITAVIVAGLLILGILGLTGDTDILWTVFNFIIVAAMLWTLIWDYQKMRARLMGVCPKCGKPSHV